MDTLILTGRLLQRAQLCTSLVTLPEPGIFNFLVQASNHLAARPMIIHAWINKGVYNEKDIKVMMS